MCEGAKQSKRVIRQIGKLPPIRTAALSLSLSHPPR